MAVLLSIKPKYVRAITAGKKKYEFRKAIFKNPDVDRILIYSSTPVRKIVGIIFVGEIKRDSPKRLWRELKDSSGLEAHEFFDYFTEKSEGFAIQIQRVKIFRRPIDPIEHFGKFTPPQSFRYIADEKIEELEALT